MLFLALDPSFELIRGLRRYDVDALFMDDVRFLAGKDGSQDESMGGSRT